MTVHDGHRVPAALDDLAGRSLTPKMLLPDSHYGSADNRALAQGRAIDLVAPARTDKGCSSGRLTLEEFSLDEAGLVVRCPNGAASLDLCRTGETAGPFRPRCMSAMPEQEALPGPG